MRETKQQRAERWARALLRTLPGWRTTPPSRGEVAAVAYAMKLYAAEAAAETEKRKRRSDAGRRRR